MKKLLRLIFIAVIAGVTYKYLTDKDIKVIDMFSKAKEWVTSMVEKVEKVEEVKEIYSSGMPDLDIKTEDEEHGTYGNQRSHYPEVSAASYSAPDASEAVEYPVADKRLPGSSKFPELDKYAMETPSEADASIEALVGWLMKPASGELEKVRLIFTWIATHVSYDDNGFNTGNYADTSPEGVFRNRVSVCQGYSELFTAMCRLAGLEAVTVIGYAKGIGYRPGSGFSDTNHAWNAARIDGEWRLFDVTWGSGYGRGVNGRLVSVQEFNDYWFSVNPDECVFSHLPGDDAWQLNHPKITRYQFESMPYVSALYFKMGFNGSQCLPAVLDGTIDVLPEAYSISGNIKVLSMPYSGRIPAGQTIKLRVKAGEGVSPAYENDGHISNMTLEGNEYTAFVKTVPGEFKLMVTYGGGSYETALEYLVQ